MKYIISFVFLLSLLPFLAVDALSEDSNTVHQTLEERKQQNYDVRHEMPTLAPNNPAIQASPDIRTPRDEQTPRDRQAVLCDPKFGGSPNDPGCQNPAPTPTPGPVTPPQGGPGPSEGENPPASSAPAGGGAGGEVSAPSAAVLGLSKTSSGAVPLFNFLGLACLIKGLILLSIRMI